MNIQCDSQAVVSLGYRVDKESCQPDITASSDPVTITDSSKSQVYPIRSADDRR